MSEHYPTLKTAADLLKALAELPPDTLLVGERADRAGIIIVPQVPSGAALICSPEAQHEPFVAAK